MLKKVEKSAKSKEEALQLAAAELGVSVEELSYSVEREVGKGLMGLLLGKEVVISAWITKEEEEEKKINAIARSRAESAKMESNESNPYAPKVQPQTHDYSSDRPKKKAKPEAEKPVAKVAKQEKAEATEGIEKPEKADKAPTVKKNREVTEKSLEDAKYFATELIHRIGLTDAEIAVENGGDCININVSGSKMGLLIGKRGDTLDAVQYLTSLYVNKAKNSYIKVNVDTENYRAKREDTLVKLAKSLERRVIRENTSVMLEPMSPNERRIIHAALQHSNRVTTHSVGEEPNRKLVVEPK